MCHDLECGSGRVHGLVLGVSGSAEMTESAFGVLELSGEAKTPGEGWGGVGGCARGFAEHGWPASASSRKSALLGQHSAPTVAASRNPRFQRYLRRLAMFFKQTPAPWSEHHAHQPCPLGRPWGVPRARLVTVVPRNFLATPGRTTDAHDARPHHQHQLHPPKQSPHKSPPRSTALDIGANKGIPLNLDHSVFAAQFSLRFLLQSSASATISDLQGPYKQVVKVRCWSGFWGFTIWGSGFRA